MRHTRTTLMATRRPRYVPCDTFAKPPRSTSIAPFEQSEMCMDFGITRCRLHVLQSLLSNFSRSRSEMVRSSRRYSLCEPRDGKRGKGMKTCLIHFTNAPLNFWFRLLQKLEERGNSREESPTLLWSCFNPCCCEVSVVMSVQFTQPNISGLLLTILQKYVVHNGELISLFWWIAPAGRDCIPNRVLQPFILTWICWTGWSFTMCNIGDHLAFITVTVWQYSCEDLIVTG
jgi:hypothetical protein